MMKRFTYGDQVPEREKGPDLSEVVLDHLLGDAHAVVGHAEIVIEDFGHLVSNDVS